MIASILPRLADPPADYRGTPFWAWNASLEPEELRAQVRAFAEMGLGGFFMHARTGLATPYLGEAWFDAVRVCLEEARAVGLSPWMYDEDRFPSGAAGGFVTKKHAYRASWLDCERVTDANRAAAAAAADTLAWFALVCADADGHPTEEADFRSPTGLFPTVITYRRVAGPDEAVRPGEMLVRYFRVIDGDSPWYNGQGYLDTLNPAAVRAFVRTTHEAYARELGEAFGTVIPGCFTDEPNFFQRAWTDGLPAAFRDKFGYDVLDHLPALLSPLLDAPFSKPRHDYTAILTDLFATSFAKTIGTWCGKRGLRFTGHALEEDTLTNQTRCAGSVMRFYEHQQEPGIDQLTERWSIYQTAKQCSSVAHQFGRPRRLVEAYGCSGWDFSLEGHKAIGDWLAALGINHRCQHLAWYSMDAEAKRDYPPSISRHSPWYRKYGRVEDYFARIGEAMSAGEETIPILVVHPVETLWGLFTPGRRDAPDLRAADSVFLATTATLLEEHLDFDYGDEDILARFGRTAGRKIRVKKAAYDAIVLPEMRTIRSSTLRLASALAACGGTVVYLGEPPAFVDAESSDAAVVAYEAFVRVTCETLPEALRKVRRVSIRQRGAECATILYQERKAGDGIVLFACNTSHRAPRTVAEQMSAPLVRDRTTAWPSVEIRVKASASTGAVYELDLETGHVRAVPFVRKAGWYRIPTSFGRLQSRLFFLTTAAMPIAPDVRDPIPPRDLMFPRTGLSYALDEDNALVLDAAEWSVDGGPVREKTRVLAIDRALREMLGVPVRSGFMAQPWCSEGKNPERTLALRLHVPFLCATIPQGPVHLAVEHPERYAISLNGTPVTAMPDGWWVDPCLQRVMLPREALRSGPNELVLACDFDETHPGLEAMFLLGAFGVSSDGRTIIPLPATLEAGDVCAQGLPNYSGNLTYSFVEDVKVVAPLRLALPKWRGTAIGFRLNGGEEIFRPFPPYEAVFPASCVKRGENRVEVVLYGHRRNAFGPFYLAGGVKWPAWTGPAEMSALDETRRALVPFGVWG